MAAPTFIQEAETAWNTSTSPKTTASFNVLATDVVVAWSVVADQVGTVAVSGGSLTWTERQFVNVSAYTLLYLWTAPVDVNKAMTVTFTRGGASGQLFGGNAVTFRGSDGVGASAKTNVSSGAPTLNLTTTQADSAVVVVVGDWAAVDGASRTWRTNAGALTEQTYFRDGSHYTVYGGYHATAGAIGTYAVGLSAPGAQKYSLAAIEVKGTVVAGGSLPPVLASFQHLLVR